MKRQSISMCCAVLLSLATPGQAAITIPGADGSDGALNITANTEIDLSQAATGTWDQNNTANAGKGVYDPGQWAVVFKYSSVNVAAGAIVTFKNHPSRAPVVWLVSGDVTVAGTVSLNGQDHQPTPLLAEAGPGGFRGGSASYLSTPRASAGFGPGGGNQETAFGAGYGASYGTASTGQSGGIYGNPSLVPLIGGSGGAADSDLNSDRRGGGGGGGALLVAAAGNVSVAGEIRGNGGAGKDYGGENTGGGSGGGIRIVCDTLQGDGRLSAVGGGGWNTAGQGRIRLERVSTSGSLQIVPSPSVINLAGGATALLWPPSTAPSVRIVSIGGAAAPSDPRASFGASGPDVAIANTSSTQVVIETTNVEQASQVVVRATPRSNANATTVNATVDSVITPAPLVVRWVATLPVQPGAAAVQVKVVRP